MHIIPRLIPIIAGGAHRNSVRVGRIELPSHPWQGRVLPLNHTRLNEFILS